MGNLRNTVELATLLRDGNGLAPTGNSMNVLMTALTAIDRVDENHNVASIPSEQDYAAAIVTLLRRKFLGSAVL